MILDDLVKAAEEALKGDKAAVFPGRGTDSGMYRRSQPVSSVCSGCEQRY